jgi:hypothetical protein
MKVHEKCIIPYRDEISNQIGFKNLHGEIVVKAEFDNILSCSRPAWHFDQYQKDVVCSTPNGTKCLIQYGHDSKEDSTFTIETHNSSLCIFKEVNDNEEAILVKEFRAEDGYDCNHYKRSKDGYLVVSLYTNDGKVYEVYDKNLVCVCGKDEPIRKYDILDIGHYMNIVVAYCKKGSYKYVLFNGHIMKVLKSCDVVHGDTIEDTIVVLVNESDKVSFVDYCTGKVLFEDNIPELRENKNTAEAPMVDVFEFGNYYKAVWFEENIYVYNVLDQKFTKLKFKTFDFNSITQDVLSIGLERGREVLYKASLDKYSDEYENLTLVNGKRDAIVKNKGKSYLLSLDTLERVSDEYDDITYTKYGDEAYIYTTVLDGKFGAISKFTKEVLLNNVYSRIYYGDSGKPEYNELEYFDGKNTYRGAYNSILKKMVIPVKYTKVEKGIYSEYLEVVKDEYKNDEHKVYRCIYNVESDSCEPVLPLDTYTSIECIGLYLTKVIKDDMVGVFKVDTQEWVLELTPNFVGKFEVDLENNQLKVIYGTETKVITL